MHHLSCKFWTWRINISYSVFFHTKFDAYELYKSYYMLFSFVRISCNQRSCGLLRWVLFIEATVEAEVIVCTLAWLGHVNWRHATISFWCVFPPRLVVSPKDVLWTSTYGLLCNAKGHSLPTSWGRLLPTSLGRWNMTSWGRPNVTSSGRLHTVLHVTPWDVPYRRLEDVPCRRYEDVPIQSNI